MSQEFSVICSSCQTEFKFDASHFGKLVSCPACGFQFPIPPRPPRIPGEQFSIERYAIPVLDLKECVADLPECQVMVKFPFEASSPISLQKVRDSLIGKSELEYIFDQSERFVLSKACYDGNSLTLEFGYRYWVYYFESRDKLVMAIEPSFAEQVDSAIGIAKSHYEIGMSLNTLLGLLPSLVQCADKLLFKAGDDLAVSRLLTDPISVLKDVANLWQHNPGYSTYRLRGGGTGLIDGIVGAVILNALSDLNDRRLHATKMQVVEPKLAAGFEQLLASQELFRLRLK